MILFQATLLLADIELLPLDGAWRYNQTENLDGVPWRSADFNDAAWPSGNGLLYVESNPSVLPRTTALIIGRTTYYFSTRFTLPVQPTNMVVSFSNRIDDGAVFYLNGREIRRVRMAAAPATINYSTLATGTPTSGDAITTEVFSLSGSALTNLVQGTNLLAVEVHQRTTTDNDVVFGSAVSVRLTNSPPVFFAQPTNLTVTDGRPASFLALPDGNPRPALQWFKNGSLITGATNATLSFPAAYPTNAGTYWIMASNSFGTNVSSNAVLTVLTDTNPPAVTAAVAQKDLTNIVLYFSESLAPGPVALLTNYEAFQTGLPANRLTVISATLQNGTNVVLTTTARFPAVNYSLRVSGIRDLASVSNAMAAGTMVPLVYQVDLVATDAATRWRYYQDGPLAATTNWQASDFDDSGWSNGAALFHGGSPLPATVDPVRSVLSLTNASGASNVAYYFRTPFVVPGLVQSNSIRLRHVVDDGAVFYLNGAEAFSIGLDTNRPVAYSNYASRSVGTATYEPAITNPGWLLNATNFAPLANVLAAEVHQSAGGLADVAFGASLEAVVTAFEPRPGLMMPNLVVEGSGTLTNQGLVFLRDPLATNFVVELSSTASQVLSVPVNVTILAGSTNATFDVQVPDDALLNGPLLVTVRAGFGGQVTSSTDVTVLDNETNSLSLIVPATFSEGQGSVTGEVHFTKPAARDMRVALASSDTSELVVPGGVVVPAGATSAVFNLSVVNDLLVDGQQSVTLSASVLGWLSAVTNVAVQDNESVALNLTLPTLVVEGSGSLTYTGRVFMSGIAVTNVVMSLNSDSPANLSVPATVTIVAGQSNVSFNLSAPDNAVVDGPRSVMVSATAPGFLATSNLVTVLDNDPHHFGFTPVGQLQTTDVSFGVTFTALDANGLAMTQFVGEVTLRANGLEGALPLEPAKIGAFSQGRSFSNVRVTVPGTVVRLSVIEAPGASDAFNVGRPTVYSLTQPVADIAWHAQSQTFFATVPTNGGIYSNQLVAIDPVSGLVTNSYPLGFDPGQIEISPGGQYLYVTLSNRTVLRRFDLNTRQAGLLFAVDTNTETIKSVRDFCVLAGTADSVVMLGMDTYPPMGNTQLGGVWRFNSGQRIALPQFTASGGWNLEGSPVAGEILLSPPLVKGPALAGVAMMTAPDFPGTTATYRDDRIYDDGGLAFSPFTLARVGAYPSVITGRHDRTLVEVGSGSRRVFFLEGYANFGTIFYKLKTYDRDLFQQLSVFDVPGTAGSPARLVRLGANGLAYCTENGLLWFVQPDLIESQRPPVDLQLSLQPVLPIAVVGTDYTFTLSLSNAGPGLASLIRVTNSLPTNAVLVQTLASTGSVAVTNLAFTWNLAALPFGSNATLQVTVRFGTGGWQTNRVWALGFETDPVFANNTYTLPLYVQLPPDGVGSFPVNFSSEDMVYDSGSDRLLLSVAEGLGGQNNGIAMLNPHLGTVESFVSLGKRPGNLTRSTDSKYLYVSFRTNGLVRRLNLPSLVTDIEFNLGTVPDSWGTPKPCFAAEMVPLPNASTSLVVWRKSIGDDTIGEYGHGIGVFDNGVMRTNLTADGGDWSLEFDTDTGALHGFDRVTGLVHPFSLEPNGVVRNTALFPVLYNTDDIEYAAGRLVTTSGRALRLQPPHLEWVLSGSENAKLVEPDASTGRAFFLAQGTVSGIRAYDLASYRPLGSIPLPTVSGTPANLIRWGTNGLAFRTTANQLFVVRSALVQPQLEANLGLAINTPSTPVSPGSNVTFTVVLTNHGPATAASLQVTNTISPALPVVTVTATAGTFATNSGQVIWSLPSLDAAQQASLTCTIRAGQTGLVTVAASLTSVSTDTTPGDNTAMALLRVGEVLGPDGYALMQLPANDLAWSPALGRLVLSCATNTPNWGGSLLTLDPASLAVRHNMILGSNANRLTISADDTTLFAGSDFGVTTVSLPSLSPVDRFPLDPGSALRQASDIKVVPGSTNLVVIGSRSGNNTRLAIYDGGVMRTNIDEFFTSGFSLAMGSDPSLFYFQDHNFIGFRRYAVNAQGVALMDTTPGLFPSGTPIGLESAGNLLFSSTGIVVDPMARQQLGVVAGVSNNAALCYDPVCNRVFFVVAGGVNPVLIAADAATFILIGSRVLSGSTGAPASLVRWGTDGLAFRTSTGQVALLRSTLVPSQAPTDLALEITSPEAIAYIGSNFVYSVSVTNQGPNVATNVQVTVRVPNYATVVGAVPSQGSATSATQQAIANLGTVPSGAGANLQITVSASQPGSIYAIASATSSAVDPDLSNNARALTNTSVLVLARDGMTVLSQSAADLAYNPLNGRLYASGKAGSIAVINPAYSQIDTNWQVAGQPGRLALSDDGQSLYASLDSGRQLARLRTSDGGIVTNFTLGVEDAGAPLTLVDMEVIPGSPDSVVAMAQGGGWRFLEVIDNGVIRSNRPHIVYGSYLEFGDNPTRVYVSGLVPMDITSNGIVVPASAQLFSTVSDFKYDHSLFYTDAGLVVDPENRTAYLRFQGLGAGTLVRPEISKHRIFFLTKLNNTWQLRAYDPLTTDLVGSLVFTNVLGTPSALVRWGEDGLAFCTTSNQVFLLRSSLIPSGNPADLKLTQIAAPAGPLSISNNVTFVLQVTNAGPADASGVLLFSRFPTNVTLVQAQLSQGTTNLSGGLLTCSLGTLTNGGTAQLTLTLRPNRAGAIFSVGNVTSANTDPDPDNNTVTSSVGVQLNLAPDSVGVLDLKTADLEYDPVSGLLYAALTNYVGPPYENCVISIDPVTGVLGTPIPVGPQLAQAAITSDGSRLYVLANNAKEFRRVNLSSGLVELTVPFTPHPFFTVWGSPYGTQIETVPGQPESLAAVVQYDAVLGGSPTFMVYDNANIRPARIQYDVRNFEFFQPNLLMGGDSTRIVLTATGVVVQASSAVHLADGDMTDDAGLIYTTAGTVFDPMSLTKLGSFGASGLVAPDQTVDRVCFLPDGGATRSLRIFAQKTRAELGAIAITNVLGTPTKLIRCGNDRLAFRTSGGQLFVVRSSLLRPSPPADLALGLAASSQPVLVGSNLLYSVSVTNLGPNSATNVIIYDTLPNAAFISASSRSGSIIISENSVTCRIPYLTNGGVAALSILVVPTQVTTVTNIASVASSSLDPDAENNSTLLTTQVAFTAGPDSVQEIKLPASDLFFDAVSGRIYASGTGLLGGMGSSIVSINPENGAIEPPILVGDNPGRLAVSDNGQYLHVGLNGSSAIRRVNLQTHTPDLLFSIGTLVDVQDLVALPGSPTSVAVSRRWLGGSPIFEGVVIFDQGVARSNVISSHTGPNAVEPGADGSVLYGYNLEDSQGGFYRMAVDANGVSLLDMSVGLIPAFTGDILFSGGRIYTTDGLVINPVTRATVGSFAGVPHASPVAVDPAAKLAFFLVPNGSNWELKTFHSDTFAPHSTITITNVAGGPSRLIRCGADRLAFLTTGGQIFVVRTSLLPSADVSISATVSASSILAGQPLTYTIIARNAGPWVATNVVLTNLLSAPASHISSTLSQGTFANNNGMLVCQLGDLAFNATATITWTVVPNNATDSVLTNSVTIASAATDSLQANNTVSILSSVRADNDRDALPDMWEQAHGLSATNPVDALLDSDCDGVNNLQEYLAGTDPLLFDGLRLSAPRASAQGQLELSLHAAVGKTYTLETSTNLTQWSPVSTFVCRSPVQPFQVPFTLSNPGSFFRLRTDTNAPLPMLELMNGPLLRTEPPLLQITAPPGRQYSVQASTNLTQWTEITNYSGMACSTLVRDPAITAGSMCFYRVVAQ